MGIKWNILVYNENILLLSERKRSDMMKRNRAFLIIGSFSLGVVLTLLLSLVFKPNPEIKTIVSPSNYGETSSITQVYDALKNYHYFYSGDDQALIDGAISGMINALDDPHPTTFSPSTSITKSLARMPAISAGELGKGDTIMV